jgi:hypothetical protein
VLTETEIRAIAQKVIDQSKSSARVDTGALRRSMAFTYIRGVVTFRQFVYGQFGDNSKLERNAIRLMPNGTKWRIVYTQFGGKEVDSTPIRNGRASQSNVIGDLFKTTTSKIRALIARKKANDGKEKN